MILDSVAVMLILDLDEKSYSFVYGVARTPCLRLQAYLAEEDKAAMDPAGEYTEEELM